MESAMNEAATQAITNIFLNPFPANDSDPLQNRFVTLNVSRENIVMDTIIELSRYNSSDLKKPLRVSIYYFIINVN